MCVQRRLLSFLPAALFLLLCTMPAWSGVTGSDGEIRTLRDNHVLVRINPQLNEAYVNTAVWNRLDIQVKENIGRSMALYCGRKKGNKLNWIVIYDTRTGKKIAKYSENWGLKIYDNR